LTPYSVFLRNVGGDIGVPSETLKNTGYTELISLSELPSQNRKIIELPSVNPLPLPSSCDAVIIKTFVTEIVLFTVAAPTHLLPSYTAISSPTVRGMPSKVAPVTYKYILLYGFPVHTGVKCLSAICGVVKDT